MPLRVKVRAVIWVDSQIVVHRVRRHGELHVTLPGGRVNERESIPDALRREVCEEVGLDVDVGDLLFAAEVVSGARRQDVELLFEARVRDPVDAQQLDLVDPSDASIDVLPPVLAEIWRLRESRDSIGRRWLGNLYSARETPM
ncbi:MAG TPA: NUDIX domain-containing protein [Solirubrobacteraceae bacterium]|nr:NUDIX domain-containing protein [Solirubrobacteraceae bacterium]